MSTHICTRCYTVAKPRRHTPGSIIIELLLWLSFIVPGLIYSVWRLTSKQNVCRTCGSPGVVPVNTPQGQHFLATMKQR